MFPVRYVPRFLYFAIGLTMCFSSIARAETCGKVFVVVQGACDKLKVGFDLSACGGDSLVGGKIEECKGDNAVVSVTSQGRKYTANLTGQTWGANTQWTPPDSVTVTGAKSSEEKKTEKKEEKKAEKKKDEKSAVAAVAETGAAAAAGAAAATTAAVSADKKAEAKVSESQSDEKKEKKKKKKKKEESVAATEPNHPVASEASAPNAVKTADGATPSAAQAAAETKAPAAAPSPAGSAAPAAEAKAAPAALPPITWYGDFRYRFEKVGQEKATPSNLWQNRIRVRMGLKADLGDDTLVDFRLASGPGRVSTNQTLGTGNSQLANYTITLDRAYFRWGFLPGISAWGGRVPNPFWIPGGGDMMWDADINFDSSVIKAEAKGPVFSPFGMAAMTWLNKTGTATSDMKLASFQAGTRVKVNDNWKGAFGVTYNRYISIVGRTNPFGSSASASAQSGNTTSGASNNVWVNGYNLINYGPEIQTRVAGEPVTLFADFVRNLAVGDENKGWNAGIKVGELKNKGDIQFCYDYRRIEKDATVDTFTDGDSANGGTDMRSHRICTSYKAGKAWHVGATFITGHKFLANQANTVKRNKFHLDLVFFF